MDIEKLKKQYKFMIHHLYKELNMYRRVNNKYRIHAEIKRKKFKYKLYEEFRVQSLYRASKLYNIIGDMQGKSVSYKLLRNKINKNTDYILTKTTETENSYINSFKNQRNWALHFSNAEFEAELEIDPEYFNHHKIIISEPKFVDYNVYFSLIQHNWSEINKAKMVLELAIKDYEILFGQKPVFEKSKVNTMDLTWLEKSVKSFKYSKK
ncbi:hypothetical protein [Salinicoccus sp. RF5]|uniref:hypothetical protein n=1 Tax=Salinicoccus sp. RF5 TaxID=2748874 RepID=UPI001E4103CB|nr:hypothetical protein [Salinicoccus sp. RF5]MCC4723559.1 hypothetical protein [Salinicoccus sp. RF5]